MNYLCLLANAFGVSKLFTSLVEDLVDLMIWTMMKISVTFKLVTTKAMPVNSQKIFEKDQAFLLPQREMPSGMKKLLS